MAGGAQHPSPSPWPVIQGGRSALSAEQREAVSELTGKVRPLPADDLKALLWLMEEFQKESYLAKVRSFDIPVIRILAEVISGWDPDGVYEFARAWVSTLIAREDGFSWAECSPTEKEGHRREVDAELTRRGICYFGPPST